ncbi:MAG: hypothetical protein IJ700_02755 [Bacteroidaceae bacterium]|nr:hypothetical protein [Bacteroidaceae bacterium]
MTLRRLFFLCIVTLSALTLRGQTGVTAETAALLQDFAHRYARQLTALKNPLLVERQLADDKVLFLQGTLKDLVHLPADYDLNITAGSGYYEMTWSHGTLPFLCLAFPAQNTLITGLSQRELVERLPVELRSQPQGFAQQPTPQGLEEVEKGVWATPEESYYLPSLNDALYYVKNQQAGFEPLFSQEHLDYSAANLLHGLIHRDFSLHVELSLFDFSSLHIKLSLSQWVHFCRSHGLHVYCGLEEEREDGLKMLLVAESRELKYNHTLSVIIPSGFVTAPDVVLQARLNGYIPTHNVKNLYKQYIEKKQKRFKI